MNRKNDPSTHNVTDNIQLFLETGDEEAANYLFHRFNNYVLWLARDFVSHSPNASAEAEHVAIQVWQEIFCKREKVLKHAKNRKVLTAALKKNVKWMSLNTIRKQKTNTENLVSVNNGLTNGEENLSVKNAPSDDKDQEFDFDSKLLVDKIKKQLLQMKGGKRNQSVLDSMLSGKVSSRKLAAELGVSTSTLDRIKDLIRDTAFPILFSYFEEFADVAGNLKKFKDE